ncbi:hypothetical protein STRIP9103_00274 [Streptomyces ipomoeae 91-03]|uniref:Uncharacterized protein n=1 Tax=Streptomyces ipomoeae 91-03 TaxID=698759 RepID=L1L2X6_9ACTN|nr:hypothetical protein STRIP9103_00274 [Streptomyces ipomoeae 91-03]
MPGDRPLGGHLLGAQALGTHSCHAKHAGDTPRAGPAAPPRLAGCLAPEHTMSLSLSKTVISAANA